MQVKAEIARPAISEAVWANTEYRMHGAAWTGEADVTKVEVSADGSLSWAAARLLDTPVPGAWRLWDYQWRTPAQPGRCIVMARATDTRGCVQSMEHDPGCRSYMISHVLPIEIDVCACEKLWLFVPVELRGKWGQHRSEGN